MTIWNTMTKKTIFILALMMLVFTSCKDKKYSNDQKKIFSTLTGNFHAYVDGEMIFSVISFTVRYSKPRPINKGKKVLFYVHGDCFFSDWKYNIPDKGYIECYYTLSREADAITFYYKTGANDKQLLRKYDLTIRDNNTFALTDNGRMLVFERVK
ncbi:MAG: hypothetical protein LBI60_05525 [Bacteroidales bacterium]|jgi:hypothetical protein|nr:hypothetical protein [Bacteroidales bacterium]